MPHWRFSIQELTIYNDRTYDVMMIEGSGGVRKYLIVNRDIRGQIYILNNVPGSSKVDKNIIGAIDSVRE